MTPRTVAAVLPFLSALPDGYAGQRQHGAARSARGHRRTISIGERLEALLADRARKPFTTVAEFRARLPEGATLASDVGAGGREQLLPRHHRGAPGRDASRARALVRRGGGAASAIVWQIVE